MRRLLRFVGWVIAIAAVFGVGWWAARVALEPPVDPTATSPVHYVEYTVVDGDVGRSLRFAALAQWSLEPAAPTGAAGVVTSINVVPGATVDVGDILYSVDLRPVTVASGAVPAFRDLTSGVQGADVVQLQQFLTDIGVYDGDIDGAFGRSTRNAVKEWQNQLGVPVDGVVRRGDLVFFPTVSTTVVLGDAVTVGAELGPRDVTVQYLGAAPRFTIPLAPEQRHLVPLDADVEIIADTATWVARIVEVIENTSANRMDLVLEGVDGGPPCGDMCISAVPIGDVIDFPTRIIVVPDTTGPVVPVAAISSGPAGETSVTALDGSLVPVTIIATSDGLAVVDGVAAGDVIQLPVTDER